MSIQFNPYFTFSGQTREAMSFYQHVFGGELNIKTFDEFQAPIADEYKEMVMHAELVTPVMTLRASDGGVMAPTTQASTNMEAAIIGDADSLEDARTWFAALEEGATNIQPFVTAPWGDTFGSLTDRFGIAWMFNFTA